MGIVTDMADAIAEFSAPFDVSRWEGGPNYTAGMANRAEPTIVPIIACVQPIDGSLASHLPEEVRSRETRELYTQTELKGVRAGQVPDEIEIDGEGWQVQTVEDWSTLAGYFRAVVARNQT